MRTKKEIIINTLGGLLSLGILFILLPSIFRWVLEKFPEQTSWVVGIILLLIVVWIFIIYGISIIGLVICLFMKIWNYLKMRIDFKNSLKHITSTELYIIVKEEQCEFWKLKMAFKEYNKRIEGNE